MLQVFFNLAGTANRLFSFIAFRIDEFYLAFRIQPRELAPVSLVICIIQQNRKV